ncbi:uncharacterized protein [Solanum tuberosum]|uniref:uncharacterized protein n=1 Tax=Solanum tuberosum TaxID=4113 RepID=UPI00073A219C|nr:PREDICTED: uncharacterized protein LOC107057901 [Solanum tuberosum]
MAAPLNMEEGQSSTRPPRFNGQYYGWWKNRIPDYINAEDTELWDVIHDGPYIPTKEVKDGELTTTVVKPRKEYNEMDRKKIEKNYKSKKILVCGIGSDAYNRISACESAKEIWDFHQTDHEGTQREGETIFEMNSRFTSITNELRCLGEPIPLIKQVRKILKVLPKSWESKVDVITEAKDLKTLAMDELIGNLHTYELNKKQGTSMKEGKREKSIALKMSQPEVTEEDDEMTYVTRRFQKIIKKHGGFQKKASTSRTTNANDLYHKCGRPGHFMRDFPSQKQETQDFRPRRRDQVLDYAKRKAHADQLVKKTLVVWGSAFSESEEETDSPEDVSMMAVEDDEIVYNSIFSLVAKSDDEKDLNEVTLFYLKDDLDTLSINRLRKLVALLIDSVDELISKNLTISEMLRLCEDENSTLNSQISEMSVRIGTLETCSLKPNEEHGTSKGGKRKLSNFEVELEEKLKTSESKLAASLERNSQLMNNLGKIKEELNHSLKWTDSSKILSNLENQRFNNKKGLGCRQIEPPYNPHSKYVSVSDNLLCIHCGKNGHLKEKCEILRGVKERQEKFLKSKKNCEKTKKKRGSSQCWYMDSECSRHMTGDTLNFLSLEAHQGGGVSFGGGNKGSILGIGRIGRSADHSIENVHYVDGDLIRGLLKLKFSNDKICDACAKGKQTRSSFKAKKGVSTTRTLELLYMDLCGPVRIQNRGGKKFILVVVDDFSRSDHGTKFENSQIEGFCAENGINHNFSAPRTPQQNGVVERKNRTLVDNARTMLIDSGLAMNFSAEAVNTTCYVTNRCLIRYVIKKTPYELLNDRNPSIAHLKPFGCKCFVLNNENDDLGKFDARSDEGGVCWGDEHKEDHELEELINRKQDDQDVKENGAEHTGVHSPSGSTQEVLSQNPEDDEGESDTDKEEEITRKSGWKHQSSHPLDNLISALDSGIQTRSRTRNLVAYSTFMSSIEPKNIKETLQDADWVTSMQEELHQFERSKVYVKQPPGFEDAELPNHVLKLDKALYGLKQAPKAWYERLSKFLLANGFKRGKIDNTLFLKSRGKELLIVQVYIDDIIFGAILDSLCKEFADLMSSEFEMNMMGELTLFLVLNTPMSTIVKLDLDEEGVEVNQTMYRGIIGSLMYLTASRPDIVFSVGMCARFQAAPNESHLKAAKRILRYLKGTQDLVFFYLTGDSFDLTGYADADYAAEAKYVAAASCCAQLLWNKQQLEDFGVLTDIIPLICDNTSAMNMAKNPVQHKRTKHIDVRHHFLRDNVEKQNVVMKFCKTKSLSFFA